MTRHAGGSGRASRRRAIERYMRWLTVRYPDSVCPPSALRDYNRWARAYNVRQNRRARVVYTDAEV